MRYYRILEPYWDKWVIDINAHTCLVSRKAIEELAVMEQVNVEYLMGQMEAIPDCNKPTEYIIGGYLVNMTPTAAQRWNEGEPSLRDLKSSKVYVTMPVNSYRIITLRRATNRKLEPEIAAAMFQEFATKQAK